MKKYLKVLSPVVLIAVLLAAAYAGYGYLSEKYHPETPEPVIVQDDVERPILNQAPDFEVLDAEGNVVTLHEQFGKPIVINIWATWCETCRSELGEFDALSAEYGDDVVFMMVNMTDGRVDTVERVKEFVEYNGYGFPVYFDTGHSASMAYDVRSIPLSIFIDEYGAIASGHLGAMDGETLRRYIENIR